MNNSEIHWDSFLKLKDSKHDLIPFKVVTGSMEPLIPVGAKVVIDKNATFKTHDIVVFWHNKKLIVHVLWSANTRVFKQGSEVFVTRSLKSSLLDTSVTREQILGKVLNYKLRWRDLFTLYISQRPKRY